MPVGSMRQSSLLLLFCLLTCSSCLTITVHGKLRSGGTLRRSVRVEAVSYQSIDAAIRRFPPPWKLVRPPSGKSLMASIEIPQGGTLPRDETHLTFSIKHHALYAEYHYHEDYSKLRLGKRFPPIAPIPPKPMLLWPRILAHERNLSVIERRARESVKMRLVLDMPGRVVDGNFDKREGGRLFWDFNLRAPAAPRATSRVYSWKRIAALALGALALFGAVLSFGLRRRSVDKL